jgi:P2-related tail formation protein
MEFYCENTSEGFEISCTDMPGHIRVSTFRAVVTIPEAWSAKTIVQPGTWELLVNYSQGSGFDMVISTKALAKTIAGVRVELNELNMPLKDIGLARVYWILQKQMCICVESYH